MSTETKDTKKSTRHGFWFGIFAGVLLGALLAGAVAGAAGPVLASRAFSHGFGKASLENPEALKERADFAASFILERVDGTEAQKAEVSRIVSETIDDLLPLAEAHRVNRQAIHDEFSKADINPEAIEEIRRSSMELADQASREITEAFTEVASTLTVEQRNELMEMGNRFHR